MIIAYLRVSTEKQFLENQRDEIRRYAESKGIVVEKWVTETISGKVSRKSRKLGLLLKQMESGDVLIVTEISRLSRTLHDIMSIMGECVERNIVVYSTKEGYSFDSSLNSKVLSFCFGLVAEIERSLISQRTKEALALRKSNGATLGRRVGTCVKMDVLRENKVVIKQMLHRGESIISICRKYKVSRSTFKSFMKETKKRAAY